MKLGKLIAAILAIISYADAYAQVGQTEISQNKEVRIFNYLTTDTQALGILTWIGFLATAIGLWVAIVQIRRTRSSAEAASLAVRGFYQTVMGREQLIELNTALANIENFKSALSRHGYDAALIYISLTKTSLIQAKQLSREDDQKLLYTNTLIQLNTMHETVSSYIENSNGDLQHMPMIISLNKITYTLHEQAAKLRYTYSPNEDAK